jgi:oligosaccharyltransferase complex subunit alpha (ribophorin I)
VALLVLAAALLVASPAAALRNANVKRTIDISTSLAVQESVVELTDGPAATFDVAVRADNATAVGDVSAAQKVDGKDENLKLIATEDTKNGDVAIKLFRFKLEKELKSGDTTTVVIRIVYVGALKPFPESIATMRDNQLVTFHDNLHFFSPYATDKETTTVKLASSALESHSPKGTVAKDVITYEAKENVAPYSYKLLQAHYQNNSPFIVAESCHRIITLTSDNINVEEHYKIVHTGATLDGSFSRLEYQYGGAATGVRGVKAIIPGSAHNIYFRDQIGNVSTSTLEESGDDILVTLNQRFPLFGGWKNDFYWGYDLPVGEYVKDAGKGSIARIPFASPLLDNYIKDMTVEIVFPLASTGIKVSIDGVEQTTVVKSTPVALEFSGGKPTHILKAKNVVTTSPKTIEVAYVGGSGSMLKYILFPGAALVILYVMVNAASTDDTASRKRQ